MTEIQPTTTINVDGTIYDVASMSADIKQMIALFDDWRAVEARCSSELMMSRHAMANMQTQLLAAIQTERQAAAEKKEVVPADTPPAAKKQSKKTTGRKG